MGLQAHEWGSQVPRPGPSFSAFLWNLHSFFLLGLPNPAQKNNHASTKDKGAERTLLPENHKRLSYEQPLVDPQLMHR